MKKHTEAICCLLLFVVIFSGCKKEESTTLYNGGITATVSGQEWISYSKKTLCSTMHGKTTLTGTGADGSTIHITLNGEMKLFEIYDLSSSGEGTAFYSIPGQPAWTTDFAFGNGQVIINKLDTLNKLMSGVFYFDAYRQSDQSTVLIESGSFYDIQYGIGAPGQPIMQNKLTVKVDGKLFKPEIIFGFESSDFISLQAYDANYINAVGIYIPLSFGPGNYTLFYSGLNPHAYGFYISGGFGGGVIGNVTITNHNRMDKKIEGKFEFSTMSSWGTQKSHSLTDGAFSIIYQ